MDYCNKSKRDIKGNNKLDNNKSDNNNKFLCVSEHHDGQRLDNFLLRELKSVPKSLIYRLLRKGVIRVNRKRSKPDLRLNIGDKMYIPSLRMSEEKKILITQDFIDRINSCILYEDDSILVINKPAGVAVHAGSGVEFGIIEAMKEVVGKNGFIELIHRLDRGTSGCLVLAKKSSVLKKLNNMLANGEIRKTYHAIVAGRWPKASHKIELPLLKKESGIKNGKPVCVDYKSGKQSLTTVSVIEFYGKNASLLSLHPKTGRTHQLRVHTSASGYPILGDQKYGDNKYSDDKRLSSRMFLHANQIKFNHPKTNEIVNIIAPYDDKFLAIIKNYKKL
jgi:23S rRNA pseudouridine955/2504/2580 synthase